MVERLTFTFALTGRRNGEHGTQGVALGSGLVGLSARAWPLTGLFTHNLPSLDTLNLNTLPVRAKVKANRSPILLPLQGVGVYALIPRALPWAENWLPFQGARGEGSN